MRPLLSAALALALTLSFAPRAEAVTVLNTATFGGHTYLEITGDTTAASGISWGAAETYAQSVGGHLATINTVAENTFIANTFNPSNNEWLWIGLNDIATEGTFVWTSGEPVNASVLAALFPLGEPSGNGDAVMLWTGSVGAFTKFQWDDFPATETIAHGQYFHAIVEINGAVPEPASLLLVAGAAGAALVRRSHRRA